MTNIIFMDVPVDKVDKCVKVDSTKEECIKATSNMNSCVLISSSFDVLEKPPTPTLSGESEGYACEETEITIDNYNSSLYYHIYFRNSGRAEPEVPVITWEFPCYVTGESDIIHMNVRCYDPISKLYSDWGFHELTLNQVYPPIIKEWDDLTDISNEWTNNDGNYETLWKWKIENYNEEYDYNVKVWINGSGSNYSAYGTHFVDSSGYVYFTLCPTNADDYDGGSLEIEVFVTIDTVEYSTNKIFTIDHTPSPLNMTYPTTIAVDERITINIPNYDKNIVGYAFYTSNSTSGGWCEVTVEGSQVHFDGIIAGEVAYFNVIKMIYPSGAFGCGVVDYIVDNLTVTEE